MGRADDGRFAKFAHGAAIAGPPSGPWARGSRPGAPMFGSFVVVPQIVQMPVSTGYGFGASVTGAGLFLFPSTVTMLVVTPFAGRLSSLFGSGYLDRRGAGLGLVVRAARVGGLQPRRDLRGHRAAGGRHRARVRRHGDPGTCLRRRGTAACGASRGRAGGRGGALDGSARFATCRLALGTNV